MPLSFAFALSYQLYSVFHIMVMNYMEQIPSEHDENALYSIFFFYATHTISLYEQTTNSAEKTPKTCHCSGFFNIPTSQYEKVYY